jgi:hypothetical protein
MSRGEGRWIPKDPEIDVMGVSFIRSSPTDAPWAGASLNRELKGCFER